jgi:uncharacterized protein YndB with AHSA1/START domain
MKENILSIILDLPIETVFEYTTNPDNTHKWLESLKQEKVDKYPIGVGTVYSNTSDGEHWSSYTVTQYEPNKLFEIKENGGTYSVKYTYELLSPNQTKLVYDEWDFDKALVSPLSQDVLEHLKKIIENK